MQAPTTNRITQGKHGTYNAVDYSASPDNKIYAPESGKITAYGPSGTCGNRLELTAGGNRHGFCHLERPLVSVGQNVTKGQAIGIMGYTGYTIPSGPSGTHLHWVINRSGTYVYPPSLVTETNAGEPPMTKAEEANAYRIVLNRAMEHAGSGRTGYQFIVAAEAELNAQRKATQNSINAIVSERDAARNQVAQLTKEVLTLRDTVTKLQADVAVKDGQLESSKVACEALIAEKESQIEELGKVIVIKDNEIKRLTDELAKVPTGDISDMSGWELLRIAINKLLKGDK